MCLRASSLALSSFFLSLSFVAACGSNGTTTTSSGGTTGQGSAELDACRALTTNASARAGRCGDAKLLFDEAHAAHLTSTCAAALTARGTRADAASVLACATALEGAACDAEAPVECNLAAGALTDGTACVSGVQCVSGSCARTAGESCGRCAAAPALGASCEPWMVDLPAGCGGGRCAWAAQVETGTVAAVCTDSRRNEHGACGDDVGGCSPGFYCELAAHSGGEGLPRTGKCVAGPAEGAACGVDGAADSRCGAGTTCVDGICRGPGAAGDRCSGYGRAAFLVDSCGAGLGCDADTKLCAAITAGKPGDACDDTTKRCDHGFCEGTSAKCVAWKALGSACDTSDVRDRCEGLATCRKGTCQLDDPAACL